MMKTLFALVAVLAAGSLWAQPAPQYFRPGAYATYKAASLQLLVTPTMQAQASVWSADPRVQELIALSMAADSLLHDGLRLVRHRGALVTQGPIDEAAVGRAIIYFNVSAGEARAWLVASRLMQLAGFRDDGVALRALEQDFVDTAGDLYLRVSTYVGTGPALSFMPRMAALWGASPAMSPRLPEVSPSSGPVLIRIPA